MEGKALNGYKIRSWGDLVAVGVVVSMLLSVVLWGLKLEGELNAIRDAYGIRIAALEARVADGILPRAEERIQQHRREINELHREIERLENRVNGS